MSHAAVSNSTCLIALERIDQTQILVQNFGTIFIPPSVQNEIGYSADWLVVKPAHNTAMVKALGTQIDAGEAEAVALATELSDVFLILDDKKARRIAREIGLQVIGTVGIILRSKRNGIIDKVKPILDALNAVNFWISDALYQRALELAGEV